MIKINNRLQTISDFIFKEDKVIDIGCDHALLDIYLYLNKDVKKIVGSDINQKPLDKAKDNLIKYNLQDKIELRLGNGLEALSNDLDTIIISGMGASSIKDILTNINNYPHIKKLIISPNNEFIKTRKDITKLNFKLVKEKMVCENNKYYLISYYEKGYSKTNYFYGKLDFKDRETINYFNYLITKNKEIISKLNNKHIFKKLKLLITNLYIKTRIK